MRHVSTLSLHRVRGELHSAMVACLLLAISLLWDLDTPNGLPRGAVVMLTMLPLIVAMSLRSSGREVWGLTAATAAAAFLSSILHYGPVRMQSAVTFPALGSITLGTVLVVIRIVKNTQWKAQQTTVQDFLKERRSWERRCRNLTTFRQIRDGAEVVNFGQLIDAIYDISHRVTGHLQPETLYPTILETTQSLLRTPHREIWLFDVEAGTFAPWNGAETPFETLRKHPRLAEWLRRERRALLRDRLNEERDFHGTLQPMDCPTAIAPLFVGGDMIGALLVNGNGSFTPHDLRLLYLLTSLSGLGIRNSMLLGQLHEMARRDGLTGLFNHASFLDECRVALNGGRPAHGTLILSDVDHFKRFNDQYGHQAGDAVLKTVADIFRDLVGAQGLVGRYGGEEFACFLPEAGLSDGRLLAETIRARLRVHRLDWDGMPLAVTCSFGVAEWGSPAQSLEELVRAADQALYAAKEAGRDCVAIYEEAQNAPLRPLPAYPLIPLPATNQPLTSPLRG